MRRGTITLVALIFCMIISAQRWVGGDISLLPEYERFNTPYKTASGETISDVVTYVHDTCGWNACRVRIFVDPCITNADGTKQGEIQDAAYAAALGARIKAAGMSFMADFHYSDTWADPVKQYIPARWRNISEDALVDSVYAYTCASLQTMIAAGATPDYVQVGNEVSYGMLWRNKDDHANPYNTLSNTEKTAWLRFARLANAGARAIREVCPDAKIILHCERTANSANTNNFYRYAQQYGIDFDVIGLSYYPFWHNGLSQLSNLLMLLERNYPDKAIQIVETAYYNNWYPSKNDGATYDWQSTWPATGAGQSAFLHDLITTLHNYTHVDGLYYWFPEENGCGGATWNANTIVITSWLNRGLWHPDTHKAFQGLMTLREFSETATSLSDSPSPMRDHAIYSLTGVHMGCDRTKLPAGYYVQDGEKFIIRP